jgi:Tetraspanin family
MYALCLLIIIVLQVLLAIFVFVYNNDIQTAANQGWDRLWAGRQIADINQRTIDQIQRQIQCCGSLGPIDYGLALPASCCSPDASACNPIFSYQTGCRSQIKGLVQNSAQWIAYLSIAMAIIEVRSLKLRKKYLANFILPFIARWRHFWLLSKLEYSKQLQVNVLNYFCSKLLLN